MAVAVIRGREMVWSLGDVETGRPLGVDSLVRAESISKSVTAWGVVRLVEDGRVGLDDSVWEQEPSTLNHSVTPDFDRPPY